MEPDESLGEDARSIAYFDMYVYVSPTCPASVSGSSCVLSLQEAELMTVTKICFRCRILQREGERDLFALRHPTMSSDDDADDDGYDVEVDFSDETQAAAGAAGRLSEATGE